MISKVGFAACSILILGCVCLRELSAPAAGGCTIGGYLALDPAESTESPKSTESIILLLIRESEGEGVCRALRVGSDCSFEGGAGGGSDDMGASSPSGPRGPRESSMASNLVGWASTRRGVRGVLGPRPTGERGAEDAESEEGGGLLLAGDSVMR